jgi:hypothetical protein
LRHGRLAAKVEAGGWQVGGDGAGKAGLLGAAHKDNVSAPFLEGASDGGEAGDRPAAGTAEGATAGMESDPRSLRIWKFFGRPVYCLGWDWELERARLSLCTQQSGDSKGVLHLVRGAKPLVYRAMGEEGAATIVETGAHRRACCRAKERVLRSPETRGQVVEEGHRIKPTGSQDGQE